jgi:hypothetical protein
MATDPSVDAAPAAASAATLAALAEVRRFFETLTPATLGELQAIYAAGAAFKDPFNDVQGLPAITRVFAHMFETLERPRFEVRTTLAGEDEAFLTWDFLYRPKGGVMGDMRVHGATYLRFDAEGRIVLHRDYWDAAGELYEKLPLLGGLMRLIRRRLSAR